jgi:hypothetical protein
MCGPMETPLYDNQPLLNYSINSPIILLTLLPPGMQLPILKENYHRQVGRNCKWLLCKYVRNSAIPLWLVMGWGYNEKVFLVHTPSIHHTIDDPLPRRVSKS